MSADLERVVRAILRAHLRPSLDWPRCYVDMLRHLRPHAWPAIPEGLHP